jgi:signal transduction histidine kinase
LYFIKFTFRLYCGLSGGPTPVEIEEAHSRMPLTKRQVIYPRLTVISLALVLALTVFLSTIALRALREKHYDVASLELSKVRLAGERVAAEFVRQTWQEAEAFLNDPALERLAFLASRPEMSSKAIKELEAELISRRPIAKHVFVISRGRVLSPSVGPAARAALVNRFGGRHEARDRRDVSADVISFGGQPSQLFYQSCGANGDLAGFLADTAWTSKTLLMRSASSVSFDARSVDQLRLQAAGTHSSLSVPLAGIFTFLQLDIPSSSIQAHQAKAKRETLYLVFSCLLLVSCVGFASVLMVRLIRELHARQLRGDFLSAFSHELKTPLTLIRLYSETLLQEDEPDPGTRATYCQIIERESERLCRLLERLLDAHRVERGQRRYRLETGNLAQAIGPTIKSYTEHLRLRGFDVELDLAEHLPPVCFDEEAISQAVLNLMDNARKYSGSLKYIGVRVFRAAQDVIVEVEDRGPGIAKEHENRIFECYYRVTDPLSRQGFGLGLYLVSDVIRAHRGRIEVKSEVGVGSRFRLIIPLEAPRPAYASALEAVKRLAAGLRPFHTKQAKAKTL